MKKYDIYSLGNALVDLEFEVTDAELKELGVEKNVMTLIDKRKHHELIEDLDGIKHAKASGGSGANSVACAQVLGAETYFTCRVGHDASGHFFYDDFHAKGVHTNLKNQDPMEGITGKCIVMLTPDAERTMCTFLGVADQYNENDIDFDALGNSTYLYTEGYAVASPHSKAAVKKAFAFAQENGVLTAGSLSDPNMVKFFRDDLVDMLNGSVDLLFCNKEEALLFCQTKSIDEAKETLKQFAKTYVITLGAKGSVAYDGSELHYSPCPTLDTPVVDTLGAGDTFAGAFLYALSKGYDYKTANELANIAGGVLVTKLGPRINTDDAETILAAHKTQKEKVV